jgi:Tol biopolymer transport system component
MSPDGRQLAISIRDRVSGNKDVWVQDLGTGLRTRFTFDAAIDDEPHWFPDGSRIVFSSDRKGRRDLFVKRVAGAGAEEVLYASETDKHPTDVSPDGRHLLFSENLPGKDTDVKLLTLGGSLTSSVVAAGPGTEMWGDFSPDGNWVTYGSTETGRMEIYARYLPALDRKWQLSTDGAGMPCWSRKGDRIYYWATVGGVHEVLVRMQGDDLVVVSTRKVFSDDALGMSWAPWFELSHDETRFLLNRNTSTGPRDPLTLVLNWPATLVTR